MRFRLATRPPLRALKAWFDIPDDNSVLDISGVKAQICSRVPQLLDEDGSNFFASEISLIIDDFELLDDSSLQVIKENDLVHITKKQKVSIQKKRKAVDDTTISSPKKRRVDLRAKRPSKTSLPSTSSSEEESSSDETTSSDSSSSSSTSSSSSSSTSASSSSSVEVQSSKRHVLQAARHDNLNIPSVPPGHGRPSTQKRNARRRLERIYQREQKQLEQGSVQALPSRSANAIPLGTHRSGSLNHTKNENAEVSQNASTSPPAEQVSPLEVESMVTTLRNKNKKKGFKQAMAGLTPQKIIFSKEAVPSETASTFHSAVSTSSAAPRPSAPHFLTLSEKQAQGLLPSNMLVTSVEVEGEKWDRGKKKKQRDQYGQDAAAEELHVDETATKQEDVTLNYGEPEIDWALIEQTWDTLKTLSSLSEVSSLNAGTVVGFKALAINPATFTPETLVHLGRVKGIRNSDSSVVLEMIPRPGSGDIAFGAFSSADEGGEGTSTDAVGEEIYTAEGVLEASWKVVKQY